MYRWGELESGQTTIAFTPRHQHETDDLTGKVQATRSDRERTPIEVCFCYPDVDAAFKVYAVSVLSYVNLFDFFVYKSEMMRCVEGCRERCGGCQRARGQGMGTEGWLRARH